VLRGKTSPIGINISSRVFDHVQGRGFCRRGTGRKYEKRQLVLPDPTWVGVLVLIASESGIHAN